MPLALGYWRVLEAEAKLAETLPAFQGQWVAVREYKVVDQADTLDELLEKVDDDTMDRIFEVKLPVAPISLLSYRLARVTRPRPR